MSTKDPLLNHMIKNIETIAQPKMVCGPSDWLKTQNESGQTIAQYQQGGPNINWMSARQNVIYLFIIDNSIDEATCNLMKQYTEAFYLGCPVKLVRPGQQVFSQKVGTKTQTMTLPEDFVATHSITMRENIGPQMHAGEILKALEPYRAKDCFCILAVTNVDIYPKEEWNYVFGLASLANSTGIFSFARH